MIPGLASRLSTMIYVEMITSNLFPYDKKKSKDGLHMRDVAMGQNTPGIAISPSSYYFEIGNENAEVKTPYYHILEDAKIIANPYQGTPKSRGSQSRRRIVSKRDYSTGTYDSTGTFSQEYRGSFGVGRRSYDKIADKVWTKESNRKKFETQNKFRYNIHFAYIERILEKTLPNIATQFGLKLYSGKATIVPERKAGYMDIKDLVALFHQSGD